MTKWQTGGWTSEKVLEELQQRSGGGRSIHFSSDGDAGLKDAIYHFFGGWPDALRAAGLHPKTRLINYWDEDEVKARIRQLAERGDPINTLHLEMNHPRLWNAARRLFGNIQKAVEAAGYDYGDVKKRGTWTRETITGKIREYYNQGLDISQIAMLDMDSKLLAAGQKFFGAWSRAVTAAGIDYAQVKSRRREAKRRLKAKGGPAARNANRMFVMRGGRLVQAD